MECLAGGVDALVGLRNCNSQHGAEIAQEGTGRAVSGQPCLQSAFVQPLDTELPGCGVTLNHYNHSSGDDNSGMYCQMPVACSSCSLLMSTKHPTASTQEVQP